MPSQLLQTAINGDEIAFIQMLWMIESQKIDRKDLKYLQKTLDKNTQGRCLTAALCIYGAPSIEIDLKKARKLLNIIVRENNFSYAVYLKYKSLDIEISKMDKETEEKDKWSSPSSPSYYFPEYAKLYEEKENTFKEAMKLKNPLLLLSTIESEKINKILSDFFYRYNSLIFPSQIPYEDIPLEIKSLVSTLKLLPMVYSQLKPTGFISQLNDAITNLTTNISILYSLYYKNEYNPHHNRADWKEYKRYTDERNFFIDFWQALADYHRNIGQRTLMLHAIQQVAEINPKKEKIWLKELGGDKLQFIDVEKYLQSFLKIAKVILSKIPTAPDEALKNVLFKQNIEFNNCKLLAEHFLQKFPSNEAKEINKLFDKCKEIEKIIERDIKQKLSCDHKESQSKTLK